MPDPNVTTTIGALPAFTLPLAGTERVPVDDGVTTRYATATGIAALASELAGVIDSAQPPYNGNIQAALNALPSMGGTVKLPSGRTNVNPPIMVQMPNTVLIGDWSRASNLVASFGHGPTLIIQPKGFGPTLVATTLTGGGLALKLDATNAGYYCLDDIVTCRLDGLAAFTLEWYYRPNTLASDVGAVVQSSGRRTQSESVTNAVALWIVAGGHPQAILNVGGAKYTLNGSSLTLSPGTGYHVSLTYDGSTIRLFGGAAGGTCNLLASQAATGTVRQPFEENLTLGVDIQDWPENGFLHGAADGTLDFVHLSKTARYTAAYSCPSAKPSRDSNTLLLCNFNNFLADGGAIVTTGGPVLMALTGANNAYLPWRPVQFPADVDPVFLRDLQITPSDTAVFMQCATRFEFRRIRLANALKGVYAVNNCFNGILENVRVTGDANVNAPSGQTACVAGFVLCHAMGGTLLYGCEADTVAYGAIIKGGSGSIDCLRVNTTPQTVCHLMLGGDGSGNNAYTIASLLVDDEPSGNPAGYAAVVILTNVDSATFLGGLLACSSSTFSGNYCVLIAGGGTIVADGVVFSGSLANTTAVFGELAAPAMVTRTTAIKSPAGLAWGA